MSMDADDFRRIAEIAQDSVVWFTDNDGIHRRCIDADEFAQHLENFAVMIAVRERDS